MAVPVSPCSVPASCMPRSVTTARNVRENRILAQECCPILAHPPSFNLRFPDWIGGPFVDWKAKVDLFEHLRREHEFGVGTIAGVAGKFGVYRRGGCPGAWRGFANA